jgi:hypothetical protein
VPTGCRKKKLKASVETIDAMTAMRSRANVPVPRTISSRTSATVVVLMCGMSRSRSVAAAIAASPASSTAASRRKAVGTIAPFCHRASPASPAVQKAIKSS